MTYTKDEIKWYNSHRNYVCQYLKITKNQYNYLRRIGNAINLLDCKYCNGDISEYENASGVYALIQKAKTYTLKIDKSFNFYHQSDPRGASFYVSNQPIIDNDYQSHSECIY